MSAQAGDLRAWACGKLVAAVPPPLSIGTVRLADGRSVKGFIIEPADVDGARDISAFNGWRAFMAGAAAEELHSLVPAEAGTTGGGGQGPRVPLRRSRTHPAPARYGRASRPQHRSCRRAGSRPRRGRARRAIWPAGRDCGTGRGGTAAPAPWWPA